MAFSFGRDEIMLIIDTGKLSNNFFLIVVDIFQH